MKIKINTRTTSGLDTEAETFSLDGSQLYVGSIADSDGTVHKAITLLSGEYVTGHLSYTLIYVIEPKDAARLLGFLDQIQSQILPATFQFPVPVLAPFLADSRLKWTVSKFVEKWHGGGGLKGSLGSKSGQIITMESAARLRDCIADFFGIDD